MPNGHRRIEDIAWALQQMEHHLLNVIRDGHAALRAAEQVDQELWSLVRDLHLFFHRIRNRLEQRDLGFEQEGLLNDLRMRCVWLYRKARGEEFLMRKLRLEEELRRMIPPEAYHVYQTLQAVEEEEEHFLSLAEPGLEGVLAESAPGTPDLQERPAADVSARLLE